MCISYSTSASASAVLSYDAPVDRLQSFVDEAFSVELVERLQDDALVLRDPWSSTDSPSAEDAQSLELLALQVEILLRRTCGIPRAPARGSISSFLRPSYSSTLISMGRPWQSQPGTYGASKPLMF